MERPVLLLDPHPRKLAEIFRPEARAQLEALGDIVAYEHGPMPPDMVDAHLPRVDVILGQTDLGTARIAAAARLRAVINVETNFLDNIDYASAFARGIAVLTPGSAFAEAVAESALGMAIDLARGITAGDRAMRAGREAYGLEGNAGAFRLAGSVVGIVGYGDLGRAFHRLLAPFHCDVRVHDPWVPDYVLRKARCRPMPLDDLLGSARVIAVFAAATASNSGFIDRARLELIRPGSVFLLLSRAAVVDFAALVACAAAGRFQAAVDVFPQEPVAPDDPLRAVEGLLLSAHRSGGMQDALFDIGDQALADLDLILRGLPPVVCRRAQRETVGLMRSKPIAFT